MVRYAPQRYISFKAQSDASRPPCAQRFSLREKGRTIGGYILAPLAVALTTWLLLTIQKVAVVMNAGGHVRPFGIAYLVPIILMTWLGGRMIGYWTLGLSLISCYDFLMRSPLAPPLRLGTDYVELLLLLVIGFLVVLGVEALVQNATLLERISQETVKRQVFLRDVLLRVTDNKLNLCLSVFDLPERKAACAAEMPLTPESLSQIRSEVHAAAKDLAFPLERESDLVTAASECCMNAVVHADGGSAQICVSQEEEMVQIWITDNGSGISFEHLPHATLEKGWSTAGSMGYGFKMMLMAADRIYLLTGPDGTTVVIEQHRNPPSAPLLS